MALVTFTSPEYRDKTVYAVAGSHTQTILKLAQENKIPINFECEDGECGTCVVRVSGLNNKERMGGPLTEKEKKVLKEIGKLTTAEMEQMIVDDLPSPWRLACQMIVRDEDIQVVY